MMLKKNKSLHKLPSHSIYPFKIDTTMLESMWDSMSSSMQLAQECLERNEEEDAADLNDPSNMDGLEKFAQTIDNSECIYSYFKCSALKLLNF